MATYLDTTGQPTLGIGICARCSRKFPLAELWSDPNAPGLKVCLADMDEFDPYRLPARQPDEITLPFYRPDLPLEGVALPRIERSLCFPGTGSLNLTGLAPLSARVPLTGGLVITGAQAQVSIQLQVIPLAGGLTMTGLSPTVQQSSAGTLAARLELPVSAILDTPASISDYTVCGWAKIIDPDPGAVGSNPVIVGMQGQDPETDDFAVALYFDISGAPTYALGLLGSINATPFDQTFSSCPDLDRWFFFAITVTASSVIARWAYLEDVAFASSVTISDGDAPIDGFGAQLGESAFDGAVTQTRQWNAALSSAQLLAEKDSITAVLSADIWADNPMQGGSDYTDSTAQAHFWAPAGGLASTTTGPANG